MIKTYTAKGIVIKQQDWRENDRLFTIYTKEYGKLRLLGPGMKKIKSKLNGQMASFGQIDLMIAKSKTYDRIASAYLQKKFDLDFEQDYFYLGFFYDLLNKSLEEAQPDEQIWLLLNRVIIGLEKMTDSQAKKVISLYFVFQLMKLLGYQPQINECVSCKSNKISQRFSLSDNGIICPNCNSTNYIDLSDETFEVIKKLSSSDKLESLNLSVTTMKYLQAFIKRWLPYVLEKEIKSLAVVF